MAIQKQERYQISDLTFSTDQRKREQPTDKKKISRQIPRPSYPTRRAADLKLALTTAARQQCVVAGFFFCNYVQYCAAVVHTAHIISNNSSSYIGRSVSAYI